MADDDGSNDVNNSGCCNQKWCWWSPRQNTIPVTFCNETSIHGFKFLGQEKRHFTERVFWFLGFCLSLATLIYLLYEVYDRYQRVPVIVSFQSSEQDVDTIPFPAVTICNMNKFPKSKVEELQRIASDPFHEEYDVARKQLIFVRNACNAQSSFAKHFGFAYQRGTDLDTSDYDKLNLTENDMVDLTDFLLWNTLPCDTLIRFCMLGEKRRPCGELFKPIITDYGKCCSFNILPLPLLLRNPDNEGKVGASPYDIPMLGSKANETWSEKELKEWADWNYDSGFVLSPDNKQPWRQKRAGLPYGLSLLVDPNVDDYYCPASDSVGVRYILHTPLEMPQVWEFSSVAHLGKEILIEVHPDVTNADDDIRGIEPERRLCFFGKERSLRFYGPYTGGNCVEECTVEVLSKKCDCTPFFLPRGTGIRICDSDPDSVSYKCAETERIKLQSQLKEVCGHCDTLCEDIAYNYETTIAESQPDHQIWGDPKPSEYLNGPPTWWNHSMGVMHIFFGAESTVPKYRKRLYGTTDLIANTGGILGLCLGFSILSGVEVLYFLTLRAYWKYCRRRMLKRRRDQQQDQQNFLSQLLFNQRATNTVIQMNPQMIPIYNNATGFQHDSKWNQGKNPVLLTTNSKTDYGGVAMCGRGWGNSQGHHFYGATSFTPKQNQTQFPAYNMY